MQKVVGLTINPGVTPSCRRRPAVRPPGLEPRRERRPQCTAASTASTAVTNVHNHFTPCLYHSGSCRAASWATTAVPSLGDPPAPQPSAPQMSGVPPLTHWVSHRHTRKLCPDTAGATTGRGRAFDRTAQVAAGKCPEVGEGCGGMSV